MLRPHIRKATAVVAPLSDPVGWVQWHSTWPLGRRMSGSREARFLSLRGLVCHRLTGRHDEDFDVHAVFAENGSHFLASFRLRQVIANVFPFLRMPYSGPGDVKALRCIVMFLPVDGFELTGRPTGAAADRTPRRSAAMPRRALLVSAQPRSSSSALAASENSSTRIVLDQDLCLFALRSGTA